MKTETFAADDKTNTSLQTILREAARLFEQGIDLTGKTAAISDACSNGASLRLAIDFNMPARLTGYLMHGDEPVELFALSANFALVRCGQGLN